MKTILITGANSGIGKALAFLTARHQNILILLARKESDVKLLTEKIIAESNNPTMEVLYPAQTFASN